MTWEPKPVPRVSPETEPFWKGTTEGELLLNECDDCGLVYYYPRALCPECFSDDVSWREASGTGEVYSYTTVYRVQGWSEEDLPLVVGYVELDEGPRMITNLVDCEPDEVEIGTRVEVTFEPTEREDVAIPLFTVVG